MICKKRRNNGLYLANKNSFFNNYTIDVFLCFTAIISLVVTWIFLYNMQAHKIKIFHNQSCFTANKTSRNGSQTGTCPYNI